MSHRPNIDAPSATQFDLVERRDNLEVLRTKVTRGLRTAVAMTLLLPGAFLFEAFVYWGEGWPPLGFPVFLVFLLFTLPLWWRWARTRRRVSHLAQEIHSLDAVELPTDSA